MKEPSDVIACIHDHGLVAVPMAQKLSKTFKKVYVIRPWEDGFASIDRAIVGDGYKEFEHVDDIWSIKDECDLFVFPDVQHSGLQLELESQGKAVWGSRAGDCLELDRELFMQTLKEVGLTLPPFHVVVGLNNLRSYLKKKEDVYIKISKFRGSMETSHWRSWDLDEGFLDFLGMQFGPAKELIRFLVFESIDTPLEIGGDTYCVDGQWPSLMLHGVEWKDRSYFGCVTAQGDMPEQIQAVLEAFGKVLGEHRYRNQWSMEVRVKYDEFYFIDATCRMGLPSTGSQLELWDNFADIVWYGANGIMVDPEPTALYSAESILSMKHRQGEWSVADFPKELKDAVKLANVCEIGGKACFPPPEPWAGTDIGWLVATGNTPEETITRINELADLLPDGVEANTESLGYVLKEIHQEEDEGIEFGKQEIPEPSTVMD